MLILFLLATLGPRSYLLWSPAIVILMVQPSCWGQNTGRKYQVVNMELRLFCTRSSAQIWTLKTFSRRSIVVHTCSASLLDEDSYAVGCRSVQPRQGLLRPHSRVGDRLLRNWLFCPQNGTPLLSAIDRFSAGERSAKRGQTAVSRETGLNLDGSRPGMSIPDSFY